MPRITTIAEARELVGRTFERDGERRRLMRITFGFEHGSRLAIAVYEQPWKTMNRLGREIPATKSCQFDAFGRWLSGATEITE